MKGTLAILWRFLTRAILGLVGVLVLLWLIVGPLAYLELSLMDLRHRMFPADGPQDIVIVEIDNSSLSRYDTWPWPRSYYGDLVDKLNGHGAKAIGFDVVFDAESGHSPEEDQRFAEALSRWDNVVLASKWYQDNRGGYMVQGWSKPIALFAEHVKTGFVNKPLDTDDRVRRAWLYYDDEEDTYKESWISQLYQKMTTTPILDAPVFSIHMMGPERSFDSVPFFVVLEDLHPNPELFKDKLVLVGATDPILHDFFYTPFGIMSGVEIHANAIQGLLNKQKLQSLPLAWDVLLTLLVLLGVWWLSRSLSGNMASVSVMIGLFGYTVLAFTVFMATSTFIALAHPLILGGLLYGAMMVFKYIRAEKDKRFIRDVFQQYVSPTVVDELLQNPEKINLGGETREVTIFFSDIRGFTTYCEGRSPEEVVDILNEYLDAMTQCIFKWQGTLDKYVGDEIMAVWGAPLAQDDHAELAVRCCWEQLQILKQLQADWVAQGRDPIDIGMGLNTGDVVVGNIGSSMHKDYTVIGDSVNLAARLEAETRNHGTEDGLCYLIISEFTYAKVKDICEVRSLGDVKVKGKEELVAIYEVTAIKVLGN